MNKVIGIILIIVMGVVFYYSSIGKFDRITKQFESDYEKILSYDLNDKYPDTPIAIIGVYAETIEYLYGQTKKGEKKTDENIQDVIYVQRKLLDQEVLDTNPEEVQVAKVKEEIQQLTKQGVYIISTKVMPEYVQAKNDIYGVKAVQYTNKKGNNYLEYYLRKDNNNRWKIVGWEDIEPFSLVK